MVGETDKELKALTDQFVCVRMVQMGGVDLAVFQFDPMLSFSIFFMNADKTIYGRYGRAHPATKRAKKDSNPNPTMAGLQATIKRALKVHASYTTEPDEVGKSLAGKTGTAPRWRFAEQSPAAKKYGRLKRISRESEHGCVHCHEVLRTAIDSHFMKKISVPDDMLWLYPRPHVLGLDFDRTACARVTSVRADSVAAEAGLEAGDEILTLAGQPLLSVADVQWILHTLPDKGGSLACEIKRGARALTLTMTLSPGWRRTEDFAWRYRMAGYAAWLWAGVSVEDTEGGIRVSQKAPNWFKRENKDATRAFEVGDLITVVDGKRGMDRSAFLAYLMREVRLGKKVKLQVQRKGEIVKVSFRIPKEQPEVQGY